MTRRVAFHWIALACFAVPHAQGFGGIVGNDCSRRILWTKKSLSFSTATATTVETKRLAKWKLYSKEEDDQEEEFKFDVNMPVIMRGSPEDEISNEVWENVDTGEPPRLVIMKELLGINIFTYILAAAIAVFLTLNLVLGPGWLGQGLGMKGAGTFTDVSTSLPDALDLSNPDFLL